MAEELCLAHSQNQQTILKQCPCRETDETQDTGVLYVVQEEDGSVTTIYDPEKRSDRLHACVADVPFGSGTRSEASYKGREDGLKRQAMVIDEPSSVWHVRMEYERGKRSDGLIYESSAIKNGAYTRVRLFNTDVTNGLRSETIQQMHGGNEKITFRFADGKKVESELKLS